MKPDPYIEVTKTTRVTPRAIRESVSTIMDIAAEFMAIIEEDDDQTPPHILLRKAAKRIVQGGAS